MAWLFLNELSRKAFHLLILVILGFYYLIIQSYPKQIGLLFLVGLLICLLIMEFLRLELGWKIPLISKIIRPKEEYRMVGAVYFLSGTLIALAVFDPKIALAALLMTTFGDMIAAIAGKRWGTTILFRNKTTVGCVAELGVNLIVGFLVLQGLPAAIYIILGMAFTATAVETFVDEMDDNLLIPLFAGLAGQLILYSI